MPLKRITLIDAHPDPDEARFVHALTSAYIDGARARGHEFRELKLSTMDVPMLRSREEWSHGAVPAAIAEAQQTIRWAEHLVFLYPLWLGDVPALLKAFLEQVMRPGFALGQREGGMPVKLLEGRSARLIVTMGMPAFFYRAYFGAHSVRSFKRNILQLSGIDPVEATLIGNVEGAPAHRERWLKRVADLGWHGE